MIARQSASKRMPTAAPREPAIWADLARSARAALRPYRGRLPHAVCEEIEQEAVLRCALSIGVSFPCAFVRRVAAHLAIDELRRARPTAPLEPSLVTDPWEQVDAGIELAQIRAALRFAPHAVRTLIEAHALGERTLTDLVDAELSTRGDHSERARARARDTVYKRRARAVAWMRTALHD
jgi:DNA-directed RNA polymerase specialized sigma24 family protein